LINPTSAKIVDPNDHSRILPVGQKGELAISGYLVQKHYWNDPVRSAEVMIPDETGRVWMHTGDEAEMDAEGYAKITGRIKDLIIRGGENIVSTLLTLEGVRLTRWVSIRWKSKIVSWHTQRCTKSPAWD
jgi:acyl-CoA synthetase (AMP-forming)/AMP-acid ligase II